METSFTGVLVRKDYKPGQGYVQLIFKGAHETKLSVSRNVRLMKSLTIGGKYKLVGREYKYGSKSIIREPKATAISLPKAKSQKKLLLIAAIVSVVFVMAGGITYAAMKQEPAAPTTPAVIEQTIEESNDLPVTTESDAETLSATTEATSNASTTAKPKTTTAPKAQSTTTTPAAGVTTQDSTGSNVTDTQSDPDPNQEEAPVVEEEAPPTEEIPPVQDPNTP